MMFHQYWRQLVVVVIGSIVASACAGAPILPSHNLPLRTSGKTASSSYDPGQVIVWLALSGGGTRAAALAYGVMERLEELALTGEGGQPSNLLREVDYISSVSGGSFAAAFYALNQTNPDWKAELRRRILDQDLERAIGRRLIEPPTFLWLTLTNYTRSNAAADYYDAHVFDQKRFRDLPVRPKLILNSSDLVTGRRFEFTPQDFACINSDLSEFRIAEAVTASSAFPGAFPSVLLDNHGPHAQCQNDVPPPPGPKCVSFQQQAAAPFVIKESRANEPDERDAVRNRLYIEKTRKLKYCDLDQTARIHLSDGGLTDNLGIDAFLYRADDPGLELHPRIFQNRAKQDQTKAVVIIVVNAANSPDENLGKKTESAWFGKIVLKGIDLFMERVAQDSLEGVRERLFNFERLVREQNDGFRFYFIEVVLDDIQDIQRRRRLQNIGTRLSLPPDQVQELIAAGRELLELGRKGDNKRDLDKVITVFNSLQR